MTREEAKALLLNISAYDIDTQRGTKKQEAIELAIKALEQESCKDAISRQAALNSLIDNTHLEGCDLAEALDAIENKEKLPPVTPQPKTGYWIYDKNIENWRCSECGETPKTLGYCGTADFMAEHFKYCNHCGAKMVEPQEGSDKE